MYISAIHHIAIELDEQNVFLLVYQGSIKPNLKKAYTQTFLDQLSSVRHILVQVIKLSGAIPFFILYPYSVQNFGQLSRPSETVVKFSFDGYQDFYEHAPYNNMPAGLDSF